MPLIARQRSRLAVLAVLALVGSLLAVSAVPAVAAADDTADNTADYSACVAAATDDAGFTDMEGNFAASQANCLAHYGITVGTGDGTTYSPNRAVLKSQMAAFLGRAAGPAGVEDKDAMLSGIGLSFAEGDATAQESVTRKEMAVYLTGFLKKALEGPGGDLTGLQSKDGLSSGATPFTDIGGVTVTQNKAIKDAFELGVTKGKTATTFAPNDLVRRDQMAVFITNALAHTNARPAGISVQALATANTGDSHDLDVSVRGSDHSVTPDAQVDSIQSTKPGEAFDDDGACVTKNVTGDCQINNGDEATDPDGNAELSVTLSSNPGTETIWVFTGATGDKFDKDTSSADMVEVDITKPADEINVTSNTKKNSKKVKFGDTVTYTLQVVDEDDKPVAKADVPVIVNAVIRVDDNNTSTTQSTMKTDASGRIELSYSQDDPNGNTTGQSATLTLRLTEPTPDTDDLGLDVSKANDQDGDAEGIQAIWSDQPSNAETLTLDQAMRYHVVSTDGVRNTFTATLVDQYGDPIRSTKVNVWSDEGTTNGGLGGTESEPADKRTTNRNGVATKSYSRSLGTADDEAISANVTGVVVQNGACLDSLDSCSETDDTTKTVAATAVTHYWATQLTVPTTGDPLPTSATGSGTVRVADVDNKTVVYGASDAAQAASWKSGDYFQIEGANTTMAAFEKELSDTPADTISVTIYKDESVPNLFNISAKGT